MNILGLQQKDVARLCNVSPSTISRYLKGNRVITIEVADKLKKALMLSDEEAIDIFFTH